MPAMKTPPKAVKKGGKKSPPKWVWIAVAVAVVIAGVLWLRSRSSSTSESNPSGYANYPSGSAYGTGGFLIPWDTATVPASTIGTVTDTNTNDYTPQAGVDTTTPPRTVTDTNTNDYTPQAGVDTTTPPRTVTDTNTGI